MPRRSAVGAELRRILADRDGVITLGQAASVGLDRSAVQRRVTSGEWMRVGRGVYFVADRPKTARARMRAACLSAGSRAVLSGVSAAWWHGLVERAPTVTSVTVPRGRHSLSIPGLAVVHRDLDTCDVTERGELPITAVPFTLIEAAESVGVAVLDAALLRGRVSLQQLLAAHSRYPGRRGAAVSSRMLRAVASGARSEAERVLHRLLREAGLVGWSAGHPTCGYVVDAAFVDVMVAVEIDGFAFHSDAEAFQYDRTRQNALVAAGWTVLRFTWRDLTERPDYIVAQIRSALEMQT